MASLTALRVGLAKELKKNPGLVQASAYQLSNFTPPCAMVMGPAEITFDRAMGHKLHHWELLVMVFVQLNDDVSSQELLDHFIATEGERSIKAALESGDRTLGGACNDLQVSKFSGYRIYQIEGSALVGGEWTVRILG